MSLRKLSRGEPVKVAAKDYNRWQDAGLASALSKLDQMAGLVLPDAQEGIILIQNTLDRALPRYSVLGINGTIANPLLSTQQSTEFQNQIALKGVLPSSTTSGKFCVLQVDAQPGEVVPAMVSGVTPVKLSVTATTDAYADIETNALLDQAKWLKTGSSGTAAQILYAPPYTGEQWGIVRLSNKPTSAVQIALARFQAHASPDPVYAYPSRTAATQDRIFPAYIQNDATFIDDPTAVGWSVTGAPTWTGTDKTAVFVQSIRNWYIPAQTELQPIFKVNGKWYCDYVKPAGPSYAVGALSGLTTTPTVINFSSIDYTAGGHIVELDLATEKFYFRRAGWVKVTVDAMFFTTALGPANSYYALMSSDGDSAMSVSQYCLFPENVNGSQYHNISRTYCFTAGAGLYFRLLASVSSGSASLDLLECNVTIDSQQHF